MDKMKKYLFFLFLLCSISVNAQIKREILGVTLGVSTENQVRETLDSKGIKNAETGGMLAAIDVKFGGQIWSSVFFNFYDNKVYSIMFMDSDLLKPTSDLLSIQDFLMDSLAQKYSKYMKNDENSLVFDDDITRIKLSYKISEEKENMHILILSYFDIELLGASALSILDDL